jgi:hypothetical protein
LRYRPHLAILWATLVWAFVVCGGGSIVVVGFAVGGRWALVVPGFGVLIWLLYYSLVFVSIEVRLWARRGTAAVSIRALN